MTTEFGHWAENHAAQYLENKGYKIVQRNYQKKWGELDIVAEKEGVLIFVEVKANKKEIIGFEPENRVSPEKLRRMNRAIQTFLAYKKYSPDQNWQIDVIALTLNRERGLVKIKHFKNVDI